MQAEPVPDGQQEEENDTQGGEVRAESRRQRELESAQCKVDRIDANGEEGVDDNDAESPALQETIERQIKEIGRHIAVVERIGQAEQLCIMETQGRFPIPGGRSAKDDRQQDAGDDEADDDESARPRQRL